MYTKHTLACLFATLLAGAPAWSQDLLQGPGTRNTKTGGPATAANAVPAEQLDALVPAARQLLKVSNVKLVQLQPRASSDLPLVDVPLDDQIHVVHLAPFTLRTPDCQLLVQDATGSLVPAELPPAATYRGHLEVEPESQVAASILNGQIYMTVVRADGQTWNVQPIKGGVLGPGLPENLHAVYKSSDVLDDEGTCGVDDDSAPNGVAGAGPVPAGNGGGDDEATPRTANVRCQIAFDADFEFYQANGSTVDATVGDMEMIMNQVGLIYQNQVAISYTETGILVRTAEPDPYTSTNANTLLCQFGEWWNVNGPFSRDVTQLFTGKDLDGTTVGLAWIGVICAGNFTNCNSNGSNLSYSLVQSRFSTNLVSRVQDSAHELGHNWSACHCNAGANCNGTSNPNDCGIMTSAISGSNTFGALAVFAITSWRDSAGCLDFWQNPTYVNWAYNGQEFGSPSQPWNTINEGVAAALVGGEVRAQAGNYLENLTIYKTVTINTLNGTVRIGN